MTKINKQSLSEQFAVQSRGIYDSLPNPTEAQFDEEVEDEEIESTSDPIDPSPLMAVQLAVAEPPVDDDEFVPVSVEELANAASVLARAVPPEEVEWYYKQLHKLVDEANDRVPQTEEDVGEEESVQEEAIKRAIRRVLYEVLTAEEEAELDQYRTGGIDYFGDVEPISAEPLEDEGMSLEDLAQEFGYSGPSGIRQEINRITSRLGYFAQQVKREDLEALMNFAVGEYIDVLGDAEVLDSEDLEELRAVPQAVKELDSFRFFFVSSFVLPAYKEVAKEAARELDGRIQDLGIPEELKLTVINQLSGRAKRSPAVIKRKLDKLVASGALDSAAAEEAAAKIEAAIPALKQAAVATPVA